MDFEIYSKIFQKNNEAQKPIIMKNISYLKIQELSLKNSFSSFFQEILTTFHKLSEQTSKNEKFLFILFLIYESSKVNMQKNVLKHEENQLLIKIIYVAFEFFMGNCSEINNISYEIRKIFIKILCNFPETSYEIFKENYNIQKIFQVFFKDDALQENTTLAERLAHFQVFLNFAKDFLLYVHKKSKQIASFTQVFLILC